MGIQRDEAGVSKGYGFVEVSACTDLNLNHWCALIGVFLRLNGSSEILRQLNVQCPT